eukprot:6679454-Prymnesium_polylepis.1
MRRAGHRRASGQRTRLVERWSFVVFEDKWWPRAHPVDAVRGDAHLKPAAVDAARWLRRRGRGGGGGASGAGGCGADH